MTKTEEKLLELLMEKVERLENEVAAIKTGDTVIHNHYHSHYHTTPTRYPNGPYWNNWPYYTTWNTAKSGDLPQTGYVSSGASGISSASGAGGGSYSLVNNASDTAKLGGSVSYNKLEDAAEYQVFALTRA